MLSATLNLLQALYNLYNEMQKKNNPQHKPNANK